MADNEAVKKVGATLPRRTEDARNALIRYIHDHSLEKGGKLPGYLELRRQFGFGSDTISAAIDSLCQLGVLEVRPKIGTFVVNPNGGQLAGRTIGVVVRALSGSAYSATLASFLQKALNERNCHCLTFYQSSLPTESPRPELDDFPGLSQSLKERRCDGLITLVTFSNAAQKTIESLGIPCCFIGDDDADSLPLSVLLEAKRFISEAADALAKRGCHRVIQLCASKEQEASRCDLLPAMVGSSYDGGAEIARKLLKMPNGRRPDGIVSDDDTIVSGLLAELLTTQGLNIAYLPEIATIVHKELGEHYPSRKMLLFEQNIEEYAVAAVELLIRVLRGLEPPKKKLQYRFVCLES